MTILKFNTMLSTALASAGAFLFIVGCASAADDQQAPDSKVAEAQSESIISPAPSVADLDHAEDDGEPRPFDEASDAYSDVDAALSAANTAGKNAIIIMGANWCHDSCALAAHFLTPRFETMLSENFEYVYVDTGIKNRNLDIAAEFGIDKLEGTPTIVFVDPRNEMVLNLDTAKTWRNAADRNVDDIYEEFLSFAPNKTSKSQ